MRASKRTSKPQARGASHFSLLGYCLEAFTIAQTQRSIPSKHVPLQIKVLNTPLKYPTHDNTFQVPVIWLAIPSPTSTATCLSQLSIRLMTGNPPKAISIDVPPGTKANTKPWSLAFTTRQHPRSLWPHINLPSQKYPTTAAPADERGETNLYLYPRAADGHPRNTME